jgi:hypothetical protein
MRRTRSSLLALSTIITVLAAGGCGLLDKLKDSPTAPSPATTSLDPFVGSFTSTSTAVPSATSCANLRYVVTPTSTTTTTSPRTPGATHCRASSHTSRET